MGFVVLPVGVGRFVVLVSVNLLQTELFLL